MINVHVDNTIKIILLIETILSNILTQINGTIVIIVI